MCCPHQRSAPSEITATSSLRVDWTTFPIRAFQLEPVFRVGKQTVQDRVLAVRKLYNLAVYDDTMWAHVSNPRVVDIIADLLGSHDIKLYGDQLFMKSPKTGSAQPWHQDSASWRDILPMDLVTAWTAIDDATMENGCLNFALGTPAMGNAQRTPTRALHGRPGCHGGGRWNRLHYRAAASVSITASCSTRATPTYPASGAGVYATHYMRANSFKDETVTDAPMMPPFKQVRGKSFQGRV